MSVDDNRFVKWYGTNVRVTNDHYSWSNNESRYQIDLHFCTEGIDFYAGSSGDSRDKAITDGLKQLERIFLHFSNIEKLQAVSAELRKCEFAAWFVEQFSLGENKP